MFNNNVTTNYNGGDATAEIIIMLLVAFILGFLLRWLWDRLYGCEEEYEEFIIDDDKQSVVEAPVKTVKNDDLKIVEGIGPKIEALLKADGIMNWRDLANSTPERLSGILKRAGDRFAFHNPNTWPEQASLADQGKWKELEEFQDFLNGGREI